MVTIKGTKITTWTLDPGSLWIRTVVDDIQNMLGYTTSPMFMDYMDESIDEE